jgi:hypothetical protein
MLAALVFHVISRAPTSNGIILGLQQIAVLR